MNAEKIIQQYMEAYNRRDIEAFLSYMHPDFESFLYDEQKRLCAGLDAARELYGKRFSENPNLYVTTLGRMVNDNVVIDRQLIEGFDGGKTIQAISIFELEGNLVKRAAFVRRTVDVPKIQFSDNGN